jgi:carbon starvation protein CstA
MPSSSSNNFNDTSSIIASLTAFSVLMAVRDPKEIIASLKRSFGLSFELSAVIAFWIIHLLRDGVRVNRFKFVGLLTCSYAPSNVTRVSGYFNRKKIFDQSAATSSYYVLSPLGVELVNATVSLLGEMATQRFERLSQEPD